MPAYKRIVNNGPTHLSRHLDHEKELDRNNFQYSTEARIKCLEQEQSMHFISLQKQVSGLIKQCKDIEENINKQPDEEAMGEKTDQKFERLQSNINARIARTVENIEKRMGALEQAVEKLGKEAPQRGRKKRDLLDGLDL